MKTRINVFLWCVLLALMIGAIGAEKANAGITSSMTKTLPIIYTGQYGLGGVCINCPAGWSATYSGIVGSITHNLNLSSPDNMRCVLTPLAFAPHMVNLSSYSPTAFSFVSFVSNSAGFIETSFSFICVRNK